MTFKKVVENWASFYKTFFLKQSVSEIKVIKKRSLKKIRKIQMMFDNLFQSQCKSNQKFFF
jgi:hypothetical protein